jgi:hypothetical protein
MGHSLYCFGVATSDPVYNPELFCKVWPHEEGSDVMETDGSGEDGSMQDEDWVRLGVSTAGVNFDT